MEPKLKVFLSSAQFEDEFVVEREGLSLLFLKEPLCSAFTLWKVEDRSAPGPIEDQYILHLRDADLVLLLLGKTFRPAVEREFEEAQRCGNPTFAFITRCENRVPIMGRFISRVKSQVTCSEYSSLIELSKKVEDSLQEYYYRSEKGLERRALVIGEYWGMLTRAGVQSVPIYRLLKALTPDERRLYELHYQDRLALAKVGHIMGVGQRVHSIHTSLLKKLQKLKLF